MYTVIIADDETAIRENLPRVIRFGDCGFSVAATAKNGEEALRLIRQHKPDLVMVDIRMPVLDGIGLIERMQAEGFEETPVIILSGYSDFSYAQKAMKLGVKAYLTKPVDEQEAETLLTEIAGDIGRREHRALQALADRRKQLLADALTGGRVPDTCAGDALLFCTALALRSEKEDAAPYRILREAAQAVFGGYDLLLNADGFLYTFYLPKVFMEGRNTDCAAIAKAFYAAAKAQGLHCALVWDTGILASEGEFSESLAERRSHMLTKVFYGCRACFDETNAVSESGCIKDRAEPLLEEIRKELDTADRDRALPAFGRLCDEILRVRPGIAFIGDLNYRLFYIFTDKLPAAETPEQVMPRPSEWANATYFHRFSDWRELQEAFIGEACTFLEQSRKMSSLGLYGEILGYVRRHYHEPITIRQVADHFFVNAAYLGRLFQKATGVGFKQYVNALRIAESKRLLLQTDKRIYEIAAQVGFSESKYFIVKFTAEEGISPTEYRKGRKNGPG